MIKTDKSKFIINSDELCSKGRNISSILCTKCKDNLSELFGTIKCDKCNQSNYKLLIAILLLLFIQLSILIFWEYFPFSSHHKNVLLIIIIYYFQLLSQIYEHSAVSHPLLSLLTIFDFSINSFGFLFPEDGLCLISNLSALGKIIYNMIFCIFVIFIIIFRLIIMFLRDNKWIQIKLTRMLLIFSGPILKMLFKLVSCFNLPNHKVVHIFDTQQQCNDIYYFIGFFRILFVIIFYVYLFCQIIDNPFKQKY